MNEQLDLFGFAPSQYIIKKPIRLIELFAGIGAQSKALEVLKANFESYKIAEWSKESIKAYTYIHHYEEIKNCNDKEITSLNVISRNYNEPMTKEQINNLKEDEKILLTNCKKITHNLIDISKVKGEDLNIVDTDKYEYVLTFSFPCTDLSLAGKGLGMEEGSGTRSSLLWEVERLLKECKEKGNLPQVLCIAENSMVYTKEGYKPIENITTNDYVLTDNGTFQKVLFVKDNGIRECFQVNATGTIPFECTSNHKVLVAHQIKNPKRKNRFLVGEITEPEWIAVKDLKKNDRLCMPINQKEIIPEWFGISSDTLRTVGRRKSRNELSEKIKTPEFWYIVGRYIGDGWIVDYNKKNGDSVIVCDKKEGLVDLENKVSKVFKCHGYLDTTACKVQICNGEFVEFLKQFGRGSKGKRLTNIILDLPHDLLESFLMGYIDSDGTYDKNDNRYAITTANKNIALELSQCITKLYSVRPTITYIKPSKSYLKETGQCIKGSGCYQVSFMTSQKNKRTSFEKECKIRFPFRSIKSVGNKHVYDIGVENVHSFTVNNVVVHNCMENVTQVIGTKNKSSFHKFMKRLEDLGYKNFVKVLNAKDFYIPQNRQRCFMVSILTKEDVFSFPNKMKLDYYLLDFLDKEVDEKYYLSDDKIIQIQNWKGFENPLEDIDPNRVYSTLTTHCGKDSNGMQLVLVPENTKKGYAEAKIVDGVYINRPHQKRGVVQKGMIQTIKTSCDDIGVVVIGGIGEKKSNNGTQWFLQDRIYNNNIATSICTSVNPYYLTKHLRIRKLTPCECYKLMGFTQRDYERCAKIQSNATIYHQAGDSIVVTVLIAIFGKLLGLDYEKVIKNYVKGEILNESEYNI